MRTINIISYIRTIIVASAIISAPLITASQPAFAQNVPISSALNERSQGLIALFNKETPYDAYFTANFLEAIPPTQIDTIINDVVKQYGKALRIISITPDSVEGGIVKLQFEKAVASIQIYTDARAPHKVSGLLLQRFEVLGDNFQSIKSEISALPGTTTLAIHKLDDNGNNRLISSHNPNKQLAIGSVFKLYVLAELAEQISKGQKNWSDVAPLAPKSTTSGGTQNWPEGSPMTLQSMASLMISISDNNTTDALINHLGRTNIEQQVRKIGHDDINKLLPFLSTAEAFSLKMKSNKNLREQFIQANEEDQKKLIVRNSKNLTNHDFNPSEFGSGPLFIDDIEWFATPADIARVMNILRQSRDPIIKEILSLNSGVTAGDAQKWDYLGYKGGSEPGVISMSFVVQSRQGEWYSVSGSWNNPQTEVDQGKWASIMSRVLNILAQ